MSKVLMDSKNLFYPRPVFLVGANSMVNPIPAVAAASSASSEPPMLAVSIRPNHYTLKGIRQNLTSPLTSLPLLR